MASSRGWARLTSIAVFLLVLVASGMLARRGLDQLADADHVVIASERMRAELNQLAAIEDAVEAEERFEERRFVDATASLRSNAEIVSEAVLPGRRDRFLSDVRDYVEIVTETTIGFEGGDDDDATDDLDALGEALFATLLDQIEVVIQDAEGDADDARNSAELALFVGAASVVSITIAVLLVDRRRKTVSTRRAEEQKSLQRVNALLEQSADHVYVVADDGSILFVSPAAPRAHGDAPTHVGQLFEHITPTARDDVGSIMANGTGTLEVQLTIEDEPVTMEVHITDRSDDEILDGTIVWARDVTEQVTLREQLRRQAREDALTGLANRRALTETVDTAIHERRESTHRVGLMLLDLDGFKGINDSLGHPAGDALLTEVARRLEGTARSTDVVGRLGGDEFALVVHDVDDDGRELQTLAERLVEVVSEPVPLGEQLVSIGVGVGWAISDDGLTADDLVRRADLALYRSKQTVPRRPVAYAADMAHDTFERSQLVSQMQEAWESGEFRLVYQPIVDLETERLVAFETLMRWRRPDGTDVLPGRFIPVAESTGQIIDLGRWALLTACGEAARWSPTGDDGGARISVNVSVVQLQEPRFVEHVREALERSGLAPRRLVLEVTESVVINSPSVVDANIEAVRELGVRIAIDDFGTGYSSMSQLQHLPVDFLKLDRSFITPLHSGDRRQVSLVTALIDLGSALGIDVIAEGVETFDQIDTLRSTRCTYAQGFVWSRPLEAIALDELLAAHHPEWSSRTARV